MNNQMAMHELKSAQMAIKEKVFAGDDELANVESRWLDFKSITSNLVIINETTDNR